MDLGAGWPLGGAELTPSYRPRWRSRPSWETLHTPEGASQLRVPLSRRQKQGPLVQPPAPFPASLDPWSHRPAALSQSLSSVIHEERVRVSSPAQEAESEHLSPSEGTKLRLGERVWGSSLYSCSRLPRA